MKKFLSLLLAVVLLAGMSSLALAEGDVSGTLSILSWYDETKSSAIIDGFKAKYPNVTIDFSYAPPVGD